METIRYTKGWDGLSSSLYLTKEQREGKMEMD